MAGPNRRNGYTPKDRYFQAAKEHGYHSRAAFKLAEIARTYPLLPAGGVVVDLGCSPGGWSQIALAKVGRNGLVIGIDPVTCPLARHPNFIFLKGPSDEAAIQARLQETLAGRRADTVLSDMAPRLSGIKFRDHERSFALACQALSVAQRILRSGGNLVVKIFPGERLPDFKKELAARFRQVHQFIPEATRRTSREIYLIAINFRGEQRG